jgi:hypothetical protein
MSNEVKEVEMDRGYRAQRRQNECMQGFGRKARRKDAITTI